MGHPGRVGCPQSQFYLDQTSLRAAPIPILDKGRVTFSAELNQICHGIEHFHASKIHQTGLLSSRRGYRYALSGAKLASKIKSLPHFEDSRVQCTPISTRAGIQFPQGYWVLAFPFWRTQ